MIGKQFLVSIMKLLNLMYFIIFRTKIAISHQNSLVKTYPSNAY